MEGTKNIVKRIRIQMANAMEEYRFSQGDIVYRFGEPCDSVWFFTEGELEIEKKGRTEKVKAAGENIVVFGENTVTDTESIRQESVLVVSHKAVGVTIDR